MPHTDTLITTLVVSLGLGLVMGLLAMRLRMPALVGYLLAGVLIGPATPGFVADVALSRQLAEIGVMLLMFGVGLEFSFEDLLAVRRIALPGAIVQMAVATSLGAAVALSWGWSPATALVFGLALSVASTVVLLRALEQHNLLNTLNGRIAVGWLVVEDIAMVLVLVVLAPLAGLLGGSGNAVGPFDNQVWTTLFLTLAGISIFIAFMLYVGRRLFPWLLWHVARTGSREMFTLCVIAAAVGIAYGSAQLFGVSFALGAFFAGMVMKESPLSQRAARESLPLRDAFSVLFFVSVGMLFDPMVLMVEPWRVVTVIAIIVVGKSLAAFALVLAFRYPLNTALTVSASLAQIGEFSFILASLGMSLGLLPSEGYSLILAGAIGSISLNALVFRAIEPAQRWIRARSRLARALERSGDPLSELPASVESHAVTGHVVLVGYGDVGRRVGASLTEHGLGFVVVEQDRELVESLREKGVFAVAGDASDASVLIQAHIARADSLVIAAGDSFRARRMIETARMLNPAIGIIVRAQSEQEAKLLERDQAGTVVLGDAELALNMSQYVVSRADKQKVDKPPVHTGG